MMGTGPLPAEFLVGGGIVGRSQPTGPTMMDGTRISPLAVMQSGHSIPEQVLYVAAVGEIGPVSAERGIEAMRRGLAERNPEDISRIAEILGDKVQGTHAEKVALVNTPPSPGKSGPERG